MDCQAERSRSPRMPIGVPFDFAQGDIMVEMLYEIASFLAITHKKNRQSFERRFCFLF